MTETIETWQERADRISKQVSDDTICQQIVYMSDEMGHDCVPMISPVKMDKNDYPFVVEAPPKGMKKPKYDWQSMTPVWVDLDSANQATTLGELTKTVTKQSKVIDSQTKTIKDLQDKLDESLQAQADLFSLVTQTNLNSTDGAGNNDQGK